MPILKREADLFPEALFELPRENYPWWVAHVRSRQEKALARYLVPFGIPFYLPQREQLVRRYGRKFQSYLPLFPGYLFFRGSRDDRYAALRSELIVQVLGVVDQARLHAELGQLYILQASGLPLVPHPYIGKGDAVRVTEGPFAGYSGFVARTKGKMRMVVSVTMLRRSVAVELDRDCLVPASPPRNASRQGSRAVA